MKPGDGSIVKDNETMRQGFRTTGIMGGSRGGMIPPGIKLLMITTGIVYLFQMMGEPFMSSFFGLRPADVLILGTEDGARTVTA